MNINLIVLKITLNNLNWMYSSHESWRVCNLFKRESFCIKAITKSALFSLSSLSTSLSVTKNCGFVQNLAMEIIYSSKLKLKFIY